MKLKKGLTHTLITVAALIMLVSIGYWGIISNCNSYKKISEETKEKVVSVVKSKIGQIPDLQTDRCKTEWSEESNLKQKKMMDKILNALNIVGESSNGKPNQYIVASFYDNMSNSIENMEVYIPYNKRNPHNRIVIKIDDSYYIATVNKESVNNVLEYMKENKTY